MAAVTAIEITEYVQSRTFRAVEVTETYEAEYVGLQSWVIQHPTEPERCYLVDMLNRDCSCPDHSCQDNEPKLDCKHIIALVPLWQELTGRNWVRTDGRIAKGIFLARLDALDKDGNIACTKLFQPDPDDPFKP